MAIAILNVSLFRTQFKEFADETKYPTEVLEVMWDVACLYISPKDWQGKMLTGKALPYAISLLMAHLMALQAARLQEENPGEAQGGFVQSATIGDVEVTKAAIPAKNMWQWWLAQTPYGQELLSLLSIASVGGTSAGGLSERDGFRKVGGVFF